MTNSTSRVRRNEEQLIADLEARIAALKARAEARKVQRDPAVKPVKQALRAIDAASSLTKDSAIRQALDEARATLSACLSLQGVPQQASATGAPRARVRVAAGAAVSVEAVLAHVRAHPGRRGEEISLALGTDSRSLRVPMKQLIADKKVKTKGQRRGMTYFPA